MMMYRENSEQLARRRRRIAVGVLALLCAVAVCIVVAYGAVSESLREQGAVSVREAILESAKQCCAVEGSYPLELSHLEDCYGLTVNHNDYIITYEAYASNVIPSVVVVPR